MTKLFGTDGVRGPVGEVVTAELALALGRAAAAMSPADAPQVLIVRDTRESGEMLEASLAAGVAAGGGHALLGGVLPTPGAALLVRRHGWIWPPWCRRPTIPTRTTGSSSSVPTG